MVEEDARDRIDAEALAVVDGQEVAVRLGYAVRAARVERSQLGLRDLANLAEHLARGRLVEADRRIDLADGLEHAGHAQPGELAGQHRLVPRSRHEAHRGQVVDLVGLGRLKRRDQRGLVEHVALDELDAVEQVLDALHRVSCWTGESCRLLDTPFRAGTRPGTSRPDR